jgi:hypothetical protein
MLGCEREERGRERCGEDFLRPACLAASAPLPQAFHVVEAWNALPEVDRTIRKLDSTLWEQGHRISFVELRTALWTTVLSEMVDANDARVTARTLKLLLNFATVPVEEEMISSDHTKCAECLTKPLTDMIGPDAQDLALMLARLLAEYQATVEGCGA